MQKIHAKLSIGESGEQRDAEITMWGAKSRMEIRFTTDAERGTESRLVLSWAEALAFTSLVCEKASEIAAISARSAARQHEE